jgi:MerR family redox-sensitive transcriptional activator SoxR
MQELTITDVARRVGVRASTIRYYESINVLPPPRRVGGRRRYDPSVLDRLAFIQITQQLGFTLTEIQRLFDHRDGATPLSELWQTLARQKLDDVERLIQHALDVKLLLVQGLRCGCSNLHDCIDCVRTQCDDRQGM